MTHKDPNPHCSCPCKNLHDLKGNKANKDVYGRNLSGLVQYLWYSRNLVILFIFVLPLVLYFVYKTPLSSARPLQYSRRTIVWNNFFCKLHSPFSAAVAINPTQLATFFLHYIRSWSGSKNGRFITPEPFPKSFLGSITVLRAMLARKAGKEGTVSGYRSPWDFIVVPYF